jgi:hypothetical protein
MKAVKISLYLCGSLMLVATVVGAIDYSKEIKNGTLKELYKEPQPAVQKNNMNSIDFDDYSRGEINRPMPQPEENTINDTEETTETKAATKKAKKKLTEESTVEKHISYKHFSRGPLPEDLEPYESIDTMPIAEKKNWDY